MKLSFESEEIPLSKIQLNTRIAVRSFQNDFSSSIIKTADSIISSSNDLKIKLNVIQFKKGLVAASAKTAFQSVPELSLVDTWILSKQLVEVLKTKEGVEYLGPQNVLMLNTAISLEYKISQIAKSLLNKERFKSLYLFATNYTKNNPITTFDFPRTNLLSPLAKHLGVADTSYVKTLGTGAEALSDIGDRIGIAKEQISQQLAWEKERLSLQWDDANISDEFLSRADSLNLILDRFTILAENSPELLGEISANIKNELMPLIYELNGGVNSSVNKLADERLQLQTYLSDLQETVIKNLNSTGDHMIEKSASSITQIIKDVAWIIILGIIILILLIFGIPFMAGFYLAKAKFNKTT
ncbi:hypothetical protein [Lutibacter oricola]|nr:hypothetical protein [Lutibacter oricola]